MGPLIPLFWTSGDISSGFQKQEWAVLFALDRNIRDVCSLIFISGATPADLWAARTTTGRFLPSATKLRRLCFYRCLSVHRGGSIPACIAGGGCYLSMHYRWYPSMPCNRSPGGCLVPEGSALRGLLQGVPAPTGGRGGVGDRPESRRLLLRTVRILLECILVSTCVSFIKINAFLSIAFVDRVLILFCTALITWTYSCTDVSSVIRPSTPTQSWGNTRKLTSHSRSVWANELHCSLKYCGFSTQMGNLFNCLHTLSVWWIQLHSLYCIVSSLLLP